MSFKKKQEKKAQLFFRKKKLSAKREKEKKSFYFFFKKANDREKNKQEKKNQQMESKLALTTVTYNNRNSLVKVVRNFLQFTAITQPLTWYMVLQNCSDDFAQQVRDEFEKHKTEDGLITLIMYRFKQNLGLSKAMAYVVEQTKYYSFTLNIEDDWILLDTHVQSKYWLDACLSFLARNEEFSAIFLRAYCNEKDKWQYGWTRHIPYRCHEFHDNFNYASKMEICKEILKERQPEDNIENKFQIIPDFLFTFNPILVRNKDYHKHVYPLPIFTNDQKDHQFQANWGCCEALVMERTRKANLKTVWFNEGIFGHNEDFFP